jgi:O-antigen/teichoic acid export membrane protein
MEPHGAGTEKSQQPDTQHPTGAMQTTAPAAVEAGFGAKLRRLGSESLIYGLSSIVGRFLSFLLTPLYAAYFTTDVNGVQSAVYTFIPIISIIFYLGMDVAYMRNSAARDGDPREKQRAFTMSFGMVALVGGVITALGLITAPALAPLFRLDVLSLRYLLAIVYTDALLAVPYAELRMSNRALRYAVYRLTYVALSLAMNIGLIAFLHWGVVAIFFSNLVANSLILFLFLPEIGRLLRPALLRGAPWKALWKYALPIMPAMLAVMLVESGDRMVLNYLPERVAAAIYHMGSKDVLGIYSFNYKLGVAMLLVVQMFRMAWTPFSLQHARHPGAPQLYSRVLTALMLICGAAFLGIALFIPTLVSIPAVYAWPKTPDYWLGLPIIPIILLGYVFSGMYAVVTAGLYIERKTHVLPWIAGVGALLNIGICIVAATRWGMVGVAWATPIAYAAMAGFGAWQSNRVYPVPFEWLRIAHLGVLVAAIYFADRWITMPLPQLAASTIGIKVALFLALPALLVATRFFRPGEWKAIRRVVRV